MEKASEFQKNIYSASLTMLKPLTVWITTNSKILYKVRVSDCLTCLLRNLYVGQEATVKTVYGTMAGLKLGKEYLKAVYCHPAYLNYIQSIPFKIQSWVNHKLESRFPGEISTTSDMQMIPL